MKIRLVAVAVALAVGLVSPVPASASDSSRLYLLESGGGDGYWSVDAADPELGAAAVHRTCGAMRATGRQRTCLTYFDSVTGLYEFTIPFAPASLVTDAGGLQSEPARFRFVLDVASPASFTVHGALSEDLDQRLSEPAVEVAPGVWEGTVADKTPLRGVYNSLELVVRTAAPGISVSLAAAGQSWFELSQPVAAAGVPELKAANPSLAVGTYQGAGRTLWFNDDGWSAASFTGDLREPRTFSFDLEERATSVIAWVETFDAPLVFDVAKGRAPDSRELENTPSLTLSGPKGVLADGANSGVIGRGQDAVAALDVVPGQLTLLVRSGAWDPDQGGQELPYEVHVVAVHGNRTLRAMRWRFGGAQHFKSPVVASCPYGLEPVPVPATVASFAVDVDWTTYAQPLPDFTLNYELPTYGSMPCGEINSSDRVRFTLRPSASVWMLGPTPTQDSAYWSWNDTLFEMQVDYTYLGP